MGSVETCEAPGKVEVSGYHIFNHSSKNITVHQHIYYVNDDKRLTYHIIPSQTYVYLEAIDSLEYITTINDPYGQCLYNTKGIYQTDILSVKLQRTKAEVEITITDAN